MMFINSSVGWTPAVVEEEVPGAAVVVAAPAEVAGVVTSRFDYRSWR